ncbi:MAG: DUF2237 family protein [Thermodesulfobacteriota bacterium]|jgi:hypothetical protein|nr:DUF2237 domain-containing protein [bacterium]RZP13117.1 MAG: DUF2237 family protein [Candidatus Dadabacteria bacterium]
MDDNQKNIFNDSIETCSNDPLTGFFRDGCCNTDINDLGEHLVCCLMSKEFLTFSKEVGNDLSTPVPEFNFPGLKEGDKWCLCAQRWIEAYDNHCAPNVFLLSTNVKTLKIIPLETLKPFAIDLG